MSNRILAIGLRAEGEGIEPAEFGGDTPFDAYRAVAVDPAAASALWAGLASEAEAETREHQDAASELLLLVQRRRREATELVRRGGTLLCILRPVGPTLRAMRRGADGTSSAVLHTYSWLPDDPALGRLVIAPAKGGEVRPADQSHPVWRLLWGKGQKASPVVCAVCTDVPANWRVVATEGEGRLVAFEARVGEGRVVFVPPLALEDPRGRGALIEGIIAAAPAAPQAPSDPDWLNAIALPGQPELAARLASLTGQVEALERELVEVRRQHSRLGRLNGLLSARTAGELAGPAAAVFHLMGFHTEVADACSLRLESDEGSALAVLAASEEAVDSDAYWDLVHRMDDGPTRVAKGIILANGFCSRPPGERGVVFPDLLRRGALHREVCLLDTVELHRAAAVLLARPDDAALRRKLRTLLLETVGPCFLSEHVPSEGS